MTTAPQQLDAWIDAHFDEEVQFLQELIRVPTDTPPGNNAPHAERTAELLAAMGLQAEKHAVPEAEVKAAGLETITNLIVRRPYGTGKTIALNAHGDVVPQAVNTDGLEPLGEEWLDENPYRDNPRAIEIGSSAYNQNCAACHGLEAKSGGIAPDLRLLEEGISGDEWFKERVINGAVRDGRVYMPKMADYLSQEALWAVRSYLESVAIQE